MGAEEIRAFLTHVAVHDKVAASTQNNALCALLFLYRDVLKQSFPELGEIEWAKQPQRMLTVFSTAEVQAVLAQLTGVHWLMASLLWGRAAFDGMSSLASERRGLCLYTNHGTRWEGSARSRHHVAAV